MRGASRELLCFEVGLCWVMPPETASTEGQHSKYFVALLRFHILSLVFALFKALLLNCPRRLQISRRRQLSEKS